MMTKLAAVPRPLCSAHPLPSAPNRSLAGATPQVFRQSAPSPWPLLDTFTRGLRAVGARVHGLVTGPNSPASRLGLDPAKWGDPVEEHAGVRLWRTDGSPMPLYLAQGTVAAPLDLVLASMLDLENSRPWLGTDNAGQVAVSAPATDRKRLDALWYATQQLPVVGERLFKMHTSVSVHSETAEVAVVTKHLGDTEWNAELARHPAGTRREEVDRLATLSGVKQARQFEVRMLLAPLPGGKTQVTLSVRIDPNVKGMSFVPGSIKQQAVRDAALGQIQGLVDRLAKASASFAPARKQINEVLSLPPAAAVA